MSSSPSSTSPPPAPSTNELLEVPSLPPSSSRFVLPPPPSDLLNRLQAFLPQIKSANEQLQTQGEAGEEAVVMEEFSSDSEDESASDDESEESSDQDEEEENGEAEGEEGRMDRLMDIGKRPKVIKKKLVVMEEDTRGLNDEEEKR